MHTLYFKHWSEISEAIKKINPQLYDAMQAVAVPSKNYYVYEIELPFGMDLIVKGKPMIFEESFLNNCEYETTGKTKIDSNYFLRDFSNRNDHPLGLIQKGIVEIYESNTYKLSENQLSYDFPLNILGIGELLGTFGATDLIYDSQLNKQHYTYSAMCANKCIYPLLPKDMGSGSEKYRKVMSDLTKEFGFKFKPRDQLFSYFPQLLKVLYGLKNKTIKLILIPDLWYNTMTQRNTELRSLISKTAWVQSREARLNDMRIIPIMNEISSTPSRKDHLISEMIAYLSGILEGKRLIMKPVNESSSAYDVYCILKDKLIDIYDPLLFHFDFLREGEWGLFPLFTFPTINPIDSINNGKEFLKTLQSSIKRIYGSDDLILKKLQYYFNDPSTFKKDTYPDRNIFTQLFLTRAILKVDLS